MTAATRDPQTGRYARIAHCPACGSWLFETLTGDLKCVRVRCEERGVVVGTSGADAGVLG